MEDKALGTAASSMGRGGSPQETIAVRTAFVARFIVLREGKRTKAHRKIERMRWHPPTSARELALAFKLVFLENGDKAEPVDRDIRRALVHAERSHRFFSGEYAKRATETFVDALYDYERSNILLFGSPAGGRPGGWRLAKELTVEDASVFVPDFLAQKNAELSVIDCLEGNDDDEDDD